MFALPLIRGVRQQRQLARPHDRDTQPALMLRAGAGNPPRQHLAALGNEAAQQLDVLVVDVVDLVRAELADLAAAEQPAPLTALLVVGLLVVATSASAAGSPGLASSHGCHDLNPSIRFDGAIGGI